LNKHILKFHNLNMYVLIYIHYNNLLIDVKKFTQSHEFNSANRGIAVCRV